MATPSSKNNPGATPTQITSSPHPSASVPMARPLSHKSPSHRTPSASGHGQAHPPGTSSHQYSTPLAAMTSMEDNVAFSSPSALLALGALGGITPSPAGNQMHDNDINSIGMSGLGITGARDADEERKKNIEEVVGMLRTRVAGRGVCREGVERLGKLEGFECMWEENNLSIAGNSVDLEIEFDADAETVKEVSLRYATPEVLEGERREEATAVLRRDLVLPPEDKARGLWKNMDNFHANLQRLAKLDKLSHDVNCFEAVEGVYESSKRIWEAEKKVSRSGGEWDHLCTGIIGRPGLHAGNRVGLGLEYWVEKRRLKDSEAEAAPNSLGPDQRRDGIWGVSIDCEEGFPSIRVSKEWVASEAITTGDQSNDKPSVNWLDPPPTTTRNHPDAMDHDHNPGNQSPATPNCRFVAKLEPHVEVPILAASEIYRQLEMELPLESKLNTFDRLLIPPQAEPGSGSQPVAFEEQRSSVEKQQERSVATFDDKKQLVMKPHRYSFHAVDHIAGCTIRELPFSHPKQLSEIFPILRQYALLTTLIRGVFSTPDGKAKEETKDVKDTKDAQSKPSNNEQSSSAGSRSPLRGVTVLSNARPAASMLESLLGDDGRADKEETEYKTKVDVSLRIPGSAPPSILLLFLPEIGTPSISMNIEVGLNGRISVADTWGIWENVLGATQRRPTGERVEKLHSKLAQVLERSEDLGTLIEWTMGWIRRRKGEKK